ncbi:MAG: pyridoxamine 5'-phosphate oxidase family protein [Candidatus Hydrogenedentes bacterium]|nr:pyridoxamine 5'-phosphate oxidase family protein [Candidatus Hydrogenedentota bacterium]
MATLPKIVLDAWENHDEPAILATLSNAKIPNIIYVSCVTIYEDECFVVADNYFDKTQKNIHEGSQGSLLFIDKEGKSYQVKGTLEYHKDGKLFDHMKAANSPKHPGHAAAVLRVKEVYSGAKKLY